MSLLSWWCVIALVVGIGFGLMCPREDDDE